MKCNHCGSSNHKNSYHLEKIIINKGYPTNSKNYQSAHKEADVKEKAKFPKGYERMKKIDNKLASNQLAGKNTKSGRIDVSSKVPKKLRSEVAFHEKTESKNLKRMRNRRSK